MPQLSLYVDDETMGMLRDGARVEGVSMSRYASNLIRDRHRRDDSAASGAWPPGYWEEVYGCLSDDEGFELPDDPPADYAELDRKLGLAR